VLVLVLAGAAGGTGWYFNSGPGSQITIPDVADTTVADATTALTDEGFVVSEKTEADTDPFIDEGKVITTDPEIGAVVVKGATVQLVLSTGPAQLEVPKLVGLSEDDALAAITDAQFTVSSDDAIRKFDSDVKKGVVLDALDADGDGLDEGDTYSEQRPIRLVVSAGALPSVKDKSVDDAIAALKDAGLGASTGEEVYDDEVDEGKVISIDREKNGDGKSRSFVVGDNDVLLIVSRGPEPVTVPNVVGLSWSEAKSILQDDGFKLDYNAIADAVAPVVTVGSVSPAAGTSQPKGTTLKISFNGF
jgi:serine/threonine-protein kinase